MVEFVELWEVIQDLVEKTFLNHGLPTLTRCFRHCIAKVLLRQTARNKIKASDGKIQELNYGHTWELKIMEKM